MRPISRVPLDAHGAEMNRRLGRDSDSFSIKAQLLRLVADDLWDVDDGRHEAEGFVHDGADHALVETAHVCFVGPVFGRARADYGVDVGLECGLGVEGYGEEEEAKMDCVGCSFVASE